MSEAAVCQEFRGEDWYAEDLGAARFVDCTFTDVDLSEVTTAGAHFERCTFHGCRFNASTHRARRSWPATSAGSASSTRPSTAAS